MADLRAGGRERRPTPELPAFCRTRRPTVLVSVSSLRSLRALLLVLIALELSTLLLLLAGPLPLRPVATVSNHVRPGPNTNSALIGPVTASPISER